MFGLGWVRGWVGCGVVLFVTVVVIVTAALYRRHADSLVYVG